MGTLGTVGRTRIGLASLLVLIALVTPRGAEALRCGGDLVSTGDPKFQVREVCGPPDHVQRLYGHERHHIHSAEVLWYYNFGPSQLLRELHFRDGHLRRIRTPDRGFREQRIAGGCRPSDIRRDMSAYELRTACGEPIQREGRHLRRHDHHGGHDHGHRRVWVEDWYYDMGSQYIDRRVRLVDGRVEDVETVD